MPPASKTMWRAGPGGQGDAVDRQLGRAQHLRGPRQAELVGRVHTPAPEVPLAVDGQPTVEGHRVGQRGNGHAGREVDLDRLRRRDRDGPVAELTLGSRPPGPHQAARSEGVAVRVRGGDGRHRAGDAGHGGRPAVPSRELALAAHRPPGQHRPRRTGLRGAAAGRARAGRRARGGRCTRAGRRAHGGTAAAAAGQDEGQQAQPPQPGADGAAPGERWPGRQRPQLGKPKGESAASSPPSSWASSSRSSSARGPRSAVRAA